MKLKYLFVYMLVVYNVLAQAQNTHPVGVEGAMLWLQTQYNANCHQLKDLIHEKTFFQSSKSCNINYNPSVVIGLKDTLSSVSIPAMSHLTVVGVYQPVDSLQEQVLLSIGSDDSVHAALTNRNLADVKQYSYMQLRHAESAHLPKLYYYTVNNCKDSLTSSKLLLHIARKANDKQIPTSDFRGLLPELLVYNRILNYREQQRLQSYMALKYGISLDQTYYPQSYYDATDTIIWDADKNNLFSHRITGLGRDDASGLYQIASSNVEMQYLPLIQLHDAQITSDKSFLLWADNGKELKLKTEKSGLSMLQRRWLVNTHRALVKAPIDITMDVLTFKDDLPQETNYWLAVDLSGTGTFPIGQTIYKKQSSRSATKIKFTDVLLTDSTHHSSVFTLFVAANLFVRYQISEPYCSNPNAGELNMQITGEITPCRVTLLRDNNLVFDTYTHADTLTIRNLSTGNYLITVTDMNGNTTGSNFYISTKDMPTMDIKEEYVMDNATALSIDASVNHTDGNYTYTWTIDNQKISNEPRIYPSKEGIYKVLVRNIEGCLQSAQTQIKVANTDKGNIEKLSVFPNPTIDGTYYLRVRLYEATPVTIHTFDTKGALIQQITLKGDQDFYAYQGYLAHPGVYMIEVSTRNSTKKTCLIRK